MKSCELLGIYQQALELTHQMSASAAAEAWDQFVQLEQQRREVIATAQACQSDPDEAVKGVIRAILDEDRVIVAEVQAWMDEIKPILLQIANVQRLGSTYQSK